MKTLHRNELLPITSLPIEELNSAEVAVKTARNTRTLDVPDTIVSTLTSDSTDSQSSEDEESNEDEPPESQTYRIPMRRNPNELGLRPALTLKEEQLEGHQEDHREIDKLQVGCSLVAG